MSVYVLLLFYNCYCYVVVSNMFQFLFFMFTLFVLNWVAYLFVYVLLCLYNCIFDM